MGAGREFGRGTVAIVRTFDVTRHSVEPTYTVRVDGDMTAYAFDCAVLTAGLDYGAKRVRAIAVGIGVGAQMALCPVGERGRSEVRHRRDHGSAADGLCQKP